MKKMKFNKWIAILAALALSSCSKDSEQDRLSNSVQENFVNLTMAKEIGSDVSFKNTNNSITNKNSASAIIKKEIESIKEVKNEKNKTVFYVINYVQGGFIILSADNRMQPIIAFSDKGQFLVEENRYSEGLKEWFKNAKTQISIVQNSNIEQTEDEKLAWRQVRNTFVNQKIFGKIPADQCYEHTVSDIKGPFIKSTWNQENGYNDALPYITCNGVNTRVLAGCVPIAMAQIMRFYKYPANYNWGDMPLDKATSTTANFILDIHNNIRSIYPSQPSYFCGATGVDINVDMGEVFKSKFRYSSANFSNYNYQVVKSNLAAGRPVILTGFGNGGHMWVCDGYQTTSYYNADCTGVSMLYFHMNWGWDVGNDKINYDGYYAYNNFNPRTSTFNDNVKMIYNIVP